MRALVYIAGPYAGTPRQRSRNVARAVAVGRLATHLGYAPIVPHAIGVAGVHGTPDESAPGVREAALACGEAHAEAVARCGGHLWLIERDHGGLSEGCARELDAYLAAGGQSVTQRPWRVFAHSLHAQGLLVPAEAA